MFLIRPKGFFLATVPAMKYWTTMMTQCRTMTTTKTLTKEVISSTMVPA